MVGKKGGINTRKGEIFRNDKPMPKEKTTTIIQRELKRDCHVKKSLSN